MPYKKEALARSMFNKNKFIPDYSTGYDVYFYVKSDTKVSNQVFEDKNTTNKRYLKKMFSGKIKSSFLPINLISSPIEFLIAKPKNKSIQ